MPRTPVLKSSSYSPTRGEHAPGDVRDAFLEAIEAFAAWEVGEPEPTVELRDQTVSLTVLCGLLWNCSDILPGLEQRELEGMVPWSHFGGDPSGRLSTYGRAARALKAMVTAPGAEVAAAA